MAEKPEIMTIRLRFQTACILAAFQRKRLQPMTPLSQGILLCLFSQLLFGVLYLFSHWMKPLGGTDVFALRMLTMAAGIWLMTLYSIGLPALGRFARERPSESPINFDAIHHNL